MDGRMDGLYIDPDWNLFPVRVLDKFMFPMATRPFKNICQSEKSYNTPKLFFLA